MLGNALAIALVFSLGIAIPGQAADEGPETCQGLPLVFADNFEQQFIGQGNTNRAIVETLELAWKLLGDFAVVDLKRIKREHIEKYRKT